MEEDARGRMRMRGGSMRENVFFGLFLKTNYIKI